MVYEPQVLVFDIGSTTGYLGFSGDDYPRCAIPNIIGSPKHNPCMVGMYAKNLYVADEANSKRDILKLRYPIKHGIINNPEDLKKIYHQGFYNELRVVPEEHPILLTENAFNTKKSRETMIEIMFEDFCVPALFVELKEILSVYSCGRTSSFILQSGGGVTTTFPLYEGYVIENGVDRVNFGGEEITNYLKKLMMMNEVSFETTADHMIANDLKEKKCYVAVNTNDELLMAQNSNSLKTTYELPDGNNIDINHERFQCTEALFNPSLIGFERYGIHEMVYNSIMKCGVNERRDFYGNIILAGGNTMFKGLAKRIENEITKLVPKQTKVRVVENSERQYTSWLGGSILASLSSFSDHLISKQDYDEVGPSKVHNKLPHLMN